MENRQRETGMPVGLNGTATKLVRYAEEQRPADCLLWR
jgi:hypothetical protein